ATHAAYVVELATLRVEAAARVAVVGRERILDLLHRQTDRGNPGWIEQHLVLHGAAAEAGVVRTPRNAPVLRLADPVLDGRQLHRRAVRALQDVAVDQARGRRQRCEGRGDAARQAQLTDPVDHLLAGEIIVSAVLKREDHM